MNPTPFRMPTARPATRLGFFLTACCILCGCADADTDPMSVLVAAETHGALAAAEQLPELPRLGVGVDLGDAGTLWSDSWSRPGEEGRGLRAEAYDEAARPLAEHLGASGIRSLLGDVRRVLRASDSLVPVETPEFVQEGLLESDALVIEADQALARGDREVALAYTLQASDRLRELAPKEVATKLIDAASEALGRNPEDASYSELDVERSRHLLISADEAMEDGDYVRAIRRAYYATRLLDVELD